MRYCWPDVEDADTKAGSSGAAMLPTGPRTPSLTQYAATSSGAVAAAASATQASSRRERPYPAAGAAVGGSELPAPVPDDAREPLSGRRGRQQQPERRERHRDSRPAAGRLAAGRRRHADPADQHGGEEAGDGHGPARDDQLRRA